MGKLFLGLVLSLFVGMMFALPDYRVAVFSVANGTNNVTFLISTQNLGTNSTLWSLTQYNSTTTPQQFISVPPLGPGQINNAYRSFPCSPGQYVDVYARADANFTINESNESNNWGWGFGRCQPPQQLPDLTVSLELNGTNFTQGGYLYYGVRATTSNIGNANAGNSTTRFYNHLGMQIIPVPPLAPGSNHVYHFSIRCGFTANASADIYNQITESNEGNNNAFLPVACPPQQPDLVVETSPHGMFGAADYSFEIRLRNIGGATAGNSTVRLTYLNTEYDMWFPSIQAGQDLVLYRIIHCQGTNVTLNATADFYNQVVESNEDNNIAPPAVSPACCRPSGGIYGCEADIQCCSGYCNELTDICEDEPELQPDLVISVLNVPRSMRQGRVYPASVTTKNNGTRVSVPSTTRVLYGGRVVAEVPVPALNPNSQLQANFGMNCLGTENGNAVVATADFGDTNAEQNENNNVANGVSSCIIADIMPTGAQGGGGDGVSPTSTATGAGGKEAEPEKGTADKTVGGPSKTSRSESILSSIGLGFVDDFFMWLGSLFGG